MGHTDMVLDCCFMFYAAAAAAPSPLGLQIATLNSGVFFPSAITESTSDEVW